MNILKFEPHFDKKRQKDFHSNDEAFLYTVLELSFNEKKHEMIGSF